MTRMAPPVVSGRDRAGAEAVVRRLVRGPVDRLSRLGAAPGLSEDQALRQGTLVLASVLIAVLSTAWVATYLALGEPWSAAIPAAHQLVTVAGLVVLMRTRSFTFFRVTQFADYLVLPALLQVALGGFVASSGIILWALIVPLAALALLGVRRATPWLVAYLALVVVLALLEPRLAATPADIPQPVATALFVLNIAGTTLTAYLMLGWFVEQRQRAAAALEVERERSERLLLNVLPDPIAQRLKADDGVIAEHYDEVSVLFADLVGFTGRAQGMPAEDLVALLDRIFSTFDRVADAEGVEKIKTIGDAYMLAGGLPEPRADHLAAVVRSALAMRDEIARIAGDPGLGWLSIRVGIDTGPAVAGVIGRRKFIYDLWGDTVNTASRMESHGLPGQIQVTERVATRLGPAFSVRPRGTIDVKGKGPMDTFLVDR